MSSVKSPVGGLIINKISSLKIALKMFQRAEEAGEDYDRVKLLEETAEDVEILERRKRKKKNMDPGFSGMDCVKMFLF